MLQFLHKSVFFENVILLIWVPIVNQIPILCTLISELDSFLQNCPSYNFMLADIRMWLSTYVTLLTGLLLILKIRNNQQFQDVDCHNAILTLLSQAEAGACPRSWSERTMLHWIHRWPTWSWYLMQKLRWSQTRSERCDQLAYSQHYHKQYKSAMQMLLRLRSVVMQNMLLRAHVICEWWQPEIEMKS